MNVTPKVSVVMSIYNSAQYLRETIDSVLAQTFTDYEFIIWNDGSTDESESIIRSYNDSRIRYFYHENTGLGTALNLACQEARGEYLARIDADDVCIPNRFEKQVAFLEKHKNVIVVSSDAWFINENGNIIDRYFNYTYSYIIRGLITNGISVIVHPAVMYRSSAYLKTTGYSQGKNFQDLILWTNMIELGDFYNIPEPLIKYRIVSSSLSHLVDSGPYVEILKEIKKKIVKDKGKNPVDFDIYNSINNLNKKEARNKENTAYKTSAAYKLYKALNRLFGDHFSSSIVYCLRNIYGFVKVKYLIR